MMLRRRLTVFRPDTSRENRIPTSAVPATVFSSPENASAGVITGGTQGGRWK